MKKNESLAEIYNSTVDRILNDPELFDELETILDEQKAIMIDGGASETEAEIYIRQPPNLTRGDVLYGFGRSEK